MAENTDLSLQRQVIYSIYVRNHTEEGTFRALIPDLDRIKALGTDIIWLMPIHPIGVEGKKGSLGCPYANRDYRDVNPAYGTMDDFKFLVSEIHKRGMKCIIDVVYNHTSPDSVLRNSHPEFFYRRQDGSFGNHLGEWSDVIDLDYNVKALWDYQIESLCMWAETVDGFRCDVASFVPLEFWKEARSAVEKVHPGAIWLAETVHTVTNNYAKSIGINAMSDADAFSAFDMEYEYDIWASFEAYLDGKTPLSGYLDMLNLQEAVYPSNYNKMHCLENHDQKRIRLRLRSEEELINYTSMLYFLKGTTLIYAGQEFENTHTPSLFEKEPIDRKTGKDISPLLKRLSSIKQLFGQSDWFLARADAENDIAVLRRGSGNCEFLGIFSLKAEEASVPVPELHDGIYEELISGKSVRIIAGNFDCSGEPAIIKVR